MWQRERRLNARAAVWNDASAQFDHAELDPKDTNPRQTVLQGGGEGVTPQLFAEERKAESQHRSVVVPQLHLRGQMFSLKLKLNLDPETLTKKNKYTEICWISCWTGVFMARIVGDLYCFSFLVLSLFWLSTKSHNKLTSQQPRVKFVRQFNPTVPVFGAGLQHKHRTSVSFQSDWSVCVQE